MIALPKQGRRQSLSQRKRVTIKEVAEKAQVSVTTVSFVLNGYHSQVSDKTITKVLKAADELGYIPNRRAQNLQSQKSGFLAMIVEDVANPFFMKLSQALVDELHDTEYTLAIINRSNRTVNDKDFWNILSNATFDGGFIISKIFDSSNFDRITNNFMPFVMLDEFVQDQDLPLVSSDNYYGGKMVGDYLVSKGHRHILCITGPNESPNSRQRYQGFKEALNEHNLTIHDIYVGSYDYDSGYQRMQELLDDQPEATAVFCFNDLMALGAVQACKNRGLEVPTDISIIGYDHVAQIYGPHSFLTTVDQGIKQIAKHAVEILIKVIDKEEISQKKILIKPSLITKESVAEVKERN